MSKNKINKVVNLGTIKVDISFKDLLEMNPDERAANLKESLKNIKNPPEIKPDDKK